MKSYLFADTKPFMEFPEDISTTEITTYRIVVSVTNTQKTPLATIGKI